MIASGHNPNDENMWTAFKDQFLEDFKDTSKKEDALTKLMGLQMKGDDLNTYTTSFNDLKELAGFEDDALGTIIAYRRGLKQPLHNAILDRQWLQPDTLLEWQDAMQRHNAAWVEKYVFGALHGLGTLGRLTEAISGQSKAKTNMSQCTGQSNRTTQSRTRQECDPDAMDVDVVQTGRMSNEERQKLIKEGHCFYCKDVGHLSQECPKKPKPCTNASPAQSRMIAMVKSSENPPVTAQNQGLGVADLAEALKNLSEEDRGRLLDEIVSGQLSF
jgi:Retrotransposon gag protein